MARILPPSVFKANFEADPFKPTMTQRVQEQWASPEGVATAVGLLDKIGGTVTDAVQSYSREQAAKSKASLDYNQQLADKRLSQLNKGQPFAEPSQSEEEFVKKQLQANSYEQGLKQAAGASDYAKRRAAIEKMNQAYNRPGTGGLLNRFTGVDQETLTKQFKRVLPPMTQQARGIKGKGSSRRPAVINQTGVTKLQEKWGRSGKWSQFSAASTLSGLGPDPFGPKGFYGPTSGNRPDPSFWVMEPDRTTYRRRLSDEEEALIADPKGNLATRSNLLQKARNFRDAAIGLAQQESTWGPGFRERFNDINWALRTIDSYRFYPNMYQDNPKAQRELAVAQEILATADDSNIAENSLATAQRWTDEGWKSPRGRVRAPIIAGAPAAQPATGAAPAQSPAAVPAPVPAQPAVAAPPPAPPATPALPSQPSAPSTMTPEQMRDPAIDRATDGYDPLAVAKDAGIPDDQPAGPMLPPGGSSQPPSPSVPGQQSMPPVMSPQQVPLVELPQQPPIYQQRVPKPVPMSGSNEPMTSNPNNLSPETVEKEKAMLEGGVDDFLIELPPHMTRAGFNYHAGEDPLKITKDFEKWHKMKKSKRIVNGKVRMPSNQFKNAATKAGKKYGIDPNIVLGIAFVESAFGSVKKDSKKNAKGPFQIIPEPKGPGGPGIGLKSNADYYNVDKSAMASAKYMKRLIDYYSTRGPNPNADHAEAIALLAYNYGRGRVNKWLAGRQKMPKEGVMYSNFVMGMRSAWDQPAAPVAPLVPLSKPRPTGPRRKPVQRKSAREQAAANKAEQEG